MEQDEKVAGNAPIREMLSTFEAIDENPISRMALNWATNECDRDDAKRIEAGIELYLGIRKHACLYCRLASYLVSLLMRKGGLTFGVSEDDLKLSLLDSYWRKGLINVISGVADFGVRKPFVPGAPFQIVWNITRACNFRCQHCYESAGSRTEDELGEPEVLKGIEAIAHANVSSLAFSGGEPTMHLSILKSIKRAEELGLYISMATNG